MENRKKVIMFWIRRICDFMRKQKFQIDPLPTIKLIDKDEQANDDSDILIPTGGYLPSTQLLLVTIDNRHIKDILRSFCHEMIHHHQWLDNSDYINRIYNVEQISENPELEEIEKEAYLLGNVYFRKFTENFQNKMKEKKQ